MSDQEIRLLRFADLKEARVCASWAQLRRMVDGSGFPPGFLLSPAVRVWYAADVAKWVESRSEASVQSEAA